MHLSLPRKPPGEAPRRLSPPEQPHFAAGLISDHCPTVVILPKLGSTCSANRALAGSRLLAPAARTEALDVSMCLYFSPRIPFGSESRPRGAPALTQVEISVPGTLKISDLSHDAALQRRH